MSRMTNLDQQTHSIRDDKLRKRLRIESLDEILDRRHMNWMEKVAKLPGNQLPRILLGAWRFGGKRRQGCQLKTLRKSYLYLLRKLQFDTHDTSDSALCTPHDTLRNIMELICNEPVELNLRLDHGLLMDMSESGLQDPITY